MRRCVSEPVSWLRLERYGLGELPPSDARALEMHLAECVVCRDCLVQISAGPDLEPVLRALPPPSAATTRRAKRIGWLGGGALASAALAAWLVVSQRTLEPHVDVTRRDSGSVKGGELALELLRVDSAGRALDATHFAPGDRFKALVTCAPGAEALAALIVFQDGETSLPLEPELLEACGNRRALAGAFRLRGGPAAVCVVLSDLPPAQLMAAKNPTGLPAAHACAQLEPE